VSFGTRSSVLLRSSALPTRATVGPPTKKKRKWPWVTLVAALIGAAIGRVAGNEVYHRFIRPAAPQTSFQVEDMMMNVVAKTKPQLPKKLDEITTMTDISYGEKRMTYVYDLIVRPAQSSDEVISALRKIVASRICASQLKRAMDYGFTFTFRYNHPRGSAIGEFSLAAADCA